MARYPRIARTFETYLTCRAIGLVIFEKTSKDGKKSSHIFIQWPTGWAALPVAGGVDDQPCWTMDILESMLQGERDGRLVAATKK